MIMSTRTRTSIPAPLQPYLRLPPAHSQILLTSTLGSSATWLTSRFVGSVLSGKDDVDGGNADDCAVVLVSWLRDEREGVEILVGLCGILMVVGVGTT